MVFTEQTGCSDVRAWYGLACLGCVDGGIIASRSGVVDFPTEKELHLDAHDS